MTREAGPGARRGVEVRLGCAGLGLGAAFIYGLFDLRTELGDKTSALTPCGPELLTSKSPPLPL